MINNLKDMLDEVEGWLELSKEEKEESKTVRIINGDNSFDLALYINNKIDFQDKDDFDNSVNIEKTIDELEKYIGSIEYSDIENISEKQRVLVNELGNDSLLEVYIKA